MANVENIKLPDLINKWMEVQKNKCNNLNDPLTIDAVNLTLLLKALGFRLENFNFDSDSKAIKNETVTIEIKCNKSGIKSSLTYNLVNCTCPEKTQVNNASFWEVQATGPKVMSRFRNATYKDASSNLLPEISDNCSQVAKAMLSNLLDFYQDNIRLVQERDRFKSPLKVYSPTIFITSPGLTMRSPYSTPPAEGKNSSKFVYPSPSPADNVKCEIKQEPPMIKIEDNEGILIKTEMLVETKKEDDTMTIEGPDLLAQVPTSATTFDVTDAHFADLDIMKDFITSSPNEKSFEAMLQANDRDVHVIQSLSDARQQIDKALLFMKINGTILLPEKTTSIITTTPQNVVVKDKKTGAIPKLPQRSNTLTSLQTNKPTSSISTGRKSIGPATITPTTSKLTIARPPTKTLTPGVTVVKKRITTSSTSSSVMTTKFVKTDTPRPILTSSLTRSKPISTSIQSTIRKPALSTLTCKTSALAKPKPVTDLKKK